MHTTFYGSYLGTYNIVLLLLNLLPPYFLTTHNRANIAGPLHIFFKPSGALRLRSLQRMDVDAVSDNTVFLNNVSIAFVLK